MKTWIRMMLLSRSIYSKEKIWSSFSRTIIHAQAGSYAVWSWFQTGLEVWNLQHTPNYMVPNWLETALNLFRTSSKSCILLCLSLSLSLSPNSDQTRAQGSVWDDPRQETILCSVREPHSSVEGWHWCTYVRKEITDCNLCMINEHSKIWCIYILLLPLFRGSIVFLQEAVKLLIDCKKDVSVSMCTQSVEDF